jgi:hypothetical protein
MKTLETVHVYNGFWQPGARCGLQVFPGTDGIPVVVLSELPSNNNTSVTNLVECLAAEVLTDYFPERIGQNPAFHCVEHYPRKPGSPLLESFDLVTFELTIPKRRLAHGKYRLSLGTPRWRRITRGELERMIGRPYPSAPQVD